MPAQAPSSALRGDRQLTAIADALEAGDVTAIRDVLYAVDLDACQQHWTACGTEVSRRHRKDAHLGRTPGKPARVSPSTRHAMGNRDGWRCRYCAVPVACDEFFTSLFAVKLAVGDSVNDLWRVFGQSPDHVVPLAVGGANTMANLVSACGSCNYAKSACTVEELGLEDPFSRQPILDGWTGLVGRPRVIA